MRTFNEKLEYILQRISREDKISYILGDFNINLLNNDYHQPTGEFFTLCQVIHFCRWLLDLLEWLQMQAHWVIIYLPIILTVPCSPVGVYLWPMLQTTIQFSILIITLLLMKLKFTWKGDSTIKQISKYYCRCYRKPTGVIFTAFRELKAV